MKKTIASLLAASLCLTLLAAPVSAAAYDQDSTETPATAITFDYKNDPTYTVTIPESLTMDKDGTEMQIEASDVAYLDGKKISVTFGGTDKFRDQILLEGKTSDGKSASIRYQIVKEDGSILETKGDGRDLVGTELVSFTDNGTASLTFRPVFSFSSSEHAGVVYTGSMTYGISLVDAQ